MKAEVKLASGTVTLHAEKMLLSVGRQANIEGIGIENTDIGTSGGFIRVNGMLQTSEPHIYAIGDVTGGVQLAHAAAHEGIMAVEHLLGLKPAPMAASRYSSLRILAVPRPPRSA